jgi:hypothetical protein
MPEDLDFFLTLKTDDEQLTMLLGQFLRMLRRHKAAKREAEKTQREALALLQQLHERADELGLNPDRKTN